MRQKTTRLLIIDDEEALRAGLKEYLSLEGYYVDTAVCAEEALTYDLNSYNLLLLDIMMDGMNGLELVKKLKSTTATANIPVIFLSAKGSDDDMVSGLKLGADDYISKPFSIKNLIARIEAVMRRTNPVKCNGIICDRTSLECLIDGQPLHLPRKEFELLALFTENPGRIFTRDEIISRIWPERTVIVERAIDVHVTRLRNKIRPYGEHIITRSGYGYGWKD